MKKRKIIEKDLKCFEKAEEKVCEMKKDHKIC